MKPLTRSILALSLACIAGEGRAAGGVVVIGHENVVGLDRATLQRIYRGTAIQTAAGVNVTAINSTSGSALRVRFLQSYMNEDEERYQSEWIARRFAGRGAPPKELTSSSAVINFVKNTPGAIGYIDEADVEPGLNVLLKP